MCGVPQGSVLHRLRPMLFLVYINDIEERVTGTILKFADDTKLFRQKIRDKQTIQDDTDEIFRWSENGRSLI